MGELKTKMNDGNPLAFLNAVAHEKRRKDSLILLEIMKEVTGEPAKMWGDSIVGFGQMTYINTTGTNVWLMTGFSPRKQSLTVYIMDGFDRYQEILSRLGKFKTAKSCLYINKLEDVDEDVLKELVAASIKYIRGKQ